MAIVRKTITLMGQQDVWIKAQVEGVPLGFGGAGQLFVAVG